MICTIKSIEKRERENALPYYVIKATHIEGGGVDAKDLFKNGMLNSMAVFSRVQNFIKTIFPPSQDIIDAMDTAYNIVEVNEPQTELSDDVNKIGLKLVRKPSPVPYNIIDAGTGEFISDTITEMVTRVNDTGKPIKVGNRIIKPNESYEIEETKDVPRVYKEIQLVVLCDENEVCIEGNEDELAMYQWNRRFGDTWIQATDE